MSQIDPADPSAGFCVSEAANFLAELTHRPLEQCAVAAAAVAPLVDSLAELRRMPIAWDGLIHRRFLLEPAEGDTASRPHGCSPVLSPSALEASSLTSSALVDPPLSTPSSLPVQVDRTVRGGWELMTAMSLASGVRVTHWLARPLSVRTSSQSRGDFAPTPEGVDDSASQGLPSLLHGGVDRERGSESAGISPAPSRGDAGSLSPVAFLDPPLIRRWGDLTGDRNAIHMIPDAAVRLGLIETPGAVLAHGVLLAALSALCELPSRRWEIRFLRPCVVPVQGIFVWPGPRAGDLLDFNISLIRRT